jgi:PIN domain nuclease of toxin-antitoxin system
MRLLLDTHVWLWFLTGDPKLSPLVKNEIQRIENEAFVSVVSLLEVAIKMKIGKLETSTSLAQLEEATLASGIKILPLNAADVGSYLTIPLNETHRDPFDQMLLAISNIHGFTLVTNDEKMKLYPDWVEVLSV